MKSMYDWKRANLSLKRKMLKKIETIKNGPRNDWKPTREADGGENMPHLWSKCDRLITVGSGYNERLGTVHFRSL